MVQRLYQLDARKFVIGNVGPIGCIPYQKTINQLNENQCVDLANKLAMQYNGRLKDLLTELNGKLPGANFVHANVYDLVMELITNYDKYGINIDISSLSVYADMLACITQIFTLGAFLCRFFNSKQSLLWKWRPICRDNSLWTNIQYVQGS